MASKLILLLTISSFFIVSLQHQILTHRNIYNSISQFGFTESLLGCKKGDTVEGINMLKKYLVRFGYLTRSPAENVVKDDTNNISYDNYFDEVTEAATKAYQLNHGLNPTGMIDSETLETISGPRCGVPDAASSEMSSNNKTYCHGTMCIQFGSHYAFWGPKWPPSKYLLSFGYANTFPQLGKDIVQSALARWSSVSPFRFVEIKDYGTADIRISFERRDHGDGLPFDGPGGILAHAFAPKDGRLHFDAEEKWAENAEPGQVDLFTVALHEIGHVLGLMHSKDKGAVMWPGIPDGVTKDLNQDDINGIQALYK